MVEIEIVENKLGTKLPQLEYRGSSSSQPEIKPEVQPEIKTKVKRKDKKFVGNIVEITSDDQIDSRRRRSRRKDKGKSGRRVREDKPRSRSGCIEIVGHLVIDNGKKTRKQVTKKSQKIISSENSSETSAEHKTRKEIIPLKRNKTRKGVYTKSNTDKRVSPSWVWAVRGQLNGPRMVQGFTVPWAFEQLFPNVLPIPTPGRARFLGLR